MRKEFCIKIIPAVGRVISEIIFLGHFEKPLVCFMHKTDIGQVVFTGVKRNDMKLWLAAMI